jgi:uncharacterized protein (TIGR02246 family)
MGLHEGGNFMSDNLHQCARLSRPVIFLIAFLSVLGATPAVWAGPAEEIAQISRERGVALEQGNVDAVVATYADNAAITPFWQAYRAEGKAAIKDLLTTLIQTYPKRQGSPRQASTRTYANDTVAVINAYGIDNWTDRGGNASVHYIRISQTWVKIDGKWLQVDQHVSRLPVP